MAKRNDDGGHPVFWLLLGFLLGVVATFGALLLLSSEVTGTGEGTAPVSDDPVITGEPPPLDGAAPPVTDGPPAAVAPPPVQTAPAPQAAPAPTPKANVPAPRPPASTSQMEEDAAATGMTSRTR